MELERKIYTTEIAGEPAKLEISQLAGKANAAVIGHHGDTVVLATVVMGENEITSDYFPLTVDYEERFYAAGKIIGSRFIRREGRPSDEAVLSGRLIDRTIRPLFDQRMRREVQATVTILAYDEVHDPDAISLLATSTALAISDIPWNGPVAGVQKNSFKPGGGVDYRMFFAGAAEGINMIEAEAAETSEDQALRLFKEAQGEIAKLVEFQKKIVKGLGKQKAQVTLASADARLKELVQNFITKNLPEAVKAKTLNDLKAALIEHLKQSGELGETLMLTDAFFEDEVNRFVHKEVLEHDRRPDGRKLNEVRDLYTEVGLFRRTHGSGLFIRGDTQILAVTTLGTPAAEQLIETMETTGRRRFMLHYNFPSFSTGETKRRGGGPGRREIGHGALAQKALVNLIPTKDRFPYTMRVVAETLSSNGSSSMASTCAASLSLMDAGVPIKKHAAGIAMGLMLGEKGTYKVLTDIQGPEDHHGDMDCKVAGTKEGITAIQMDVKIEGITEEIFRDTLRDAKHAREHILEVMEKTLPAPRPTVSEFAPTIQILTIPTDKIGLVIGPGGKTINGLVAAAGGLVAIDIEQDGKVYVSGLDPRLVQNTLNAVKQLVHEYQVGEIVEGTVVKILDFGAIVDLGGGKDGMIHVSELKDGFVKRVEDVVNLGDRVRVKVIRAEPDGKIGLSIKALNQK